MDQELRELLRQLPDDVRQWIEDLIAGGLRLSPSELRQLLIALIAAGGNPALVLRILTMLARMGLIDGEVLAAAAAEAETIMAEAAASEAGAGGAAAGGLTAGALGAILFAVAALAFAGWAIISEALTPLTPAASGGSPCGLGTPGGRMMATTDLTITVRAWGGRTSYNKAMAEAEVMCASLASNCGAGACPSGKSCKPALSVQAVDQSFRFFWTTTTVTFRCPCECQ